MQLFLNGRFVPAAKAVVPLFDRGLLYGDGLFEAMRVRDGKIPLFARHLARLQAGAKFLRLKLPYSPERIALLAAEVIALNKARDGLLRFTLTRGVGQRGYSPRGADKPTFAISFHPLPSPLKTYRLITASLRQPAGQPYARFKTADKLLQVLARAEADDVGADEALVLNTRGRVAETSSGNVFLLRNGKVITPPLAAGVLAGVTRATVLELCAALGITAREQDFTKAALMKADGAFVTQTSLGIVEIVSLDGRKLRRSPLVAKLRHAFETRLADA